MDVDSRRSPVHGDATIGSMPSHCPPTCPAVSRTSGYYPTLVADVLDVAVAGEDVRAQLVHARDDLRRETVRRHLSVIVLTGTRLIFVHADDHGGDEEHSAESHGIVTSESVPLSAVRTVMITHVVPVARALPGRPARARS